MTDHLFTEINLKALILKRLLETIDEKASIIKNEIQLAIETRDNETKSNVGDKFETTREMMQLEIEKNVLQLNKYKLQKNELLKININKTCKNVEPGSLVFTAENTYFFSIGIGKIEIENETVFCISLISPIGKTLQNKKAGEKINFQGKEISILKIT
ncbi:MAG: transcription elongation [Prolixibacteraceae bacterium]|nr:MAG: transcription elongation [Prolixibacteraceae bacterium]